MDKRDLTSQEHLPPHEIREIPRWSRAYARNRALPVMVMLVVFLLIAYAIGQFSQSAGEAYRAGHMLAFGFTIAALAVCCGAAVSFAIPRVFGKICRILMAWCYPNEGEVFIAPASRSSIRKPLLYFFLFLMAVGVPTQALLGSRIPEDYVQPVSALYVVPFLSALALALRPAAGILSFLWPILYALHAVLILAGAPILFRGEWSNLNIILPACGYGILSSLLGHAYSRYSLRRLRRSGLNGGEGTGVFGRQP